MPYEGYISLGGEEIANNARFSVYANTMGVLTGEQGCPCPNTAAILDDPEYQSPQLDFAPWYDADQPRSLEFAGVMIERITGLDDGTITRGFQPVTQGGGVPGLPLDEVRTIGVTAWIGASTDAGFSYGLAWLTAQLRASADCDPGGNGDELCVWAFCPDEVPEGEGAIVWQETGRMLYDVVLVDGPKTITKFPTRTSCAGTQAFIAQVEFTLQAGAPGIFHTPTTLGTELTFVSDPEGVCDIVWQMAPDCTPDCPPVPTASQDPLCVTVAAPTAPRVISACSCVSRIVSARIVSQVLNGTMPRQIEAVPLVQIRAGGQELRRLSVRFYSERTTAPVVGLVISDPVTPTASDVILKAQVEGLGYTCNYIDDTSPEPAAGYDLFIITEDASVSPLGTKYISTRVPVICLEHLYWQEMKLSTADGAVSAASATLDLVTHEVTAGLPDPLTVLPVAQTQRSVANAALPAGALTFALEGGDPTRTVGWTVDKGEAMTSGTAPARRAALGYRDGWVDDLTADGLQLFDNLVQWALGSFECNILDPCFECAEINLTFVPANAVVTLDGRRRRATILVEGGVEEPTDRYLFGRDGAPVEWPVIECGIGLCIEVLVDADFYGPDTQVDLYLVAKEDAV